MNSCLPLTIGLLEVVAFGATLVTMCLYPPRLMLLAGSQLWPSGLPLLVARRRRSPLRRQVGGKGIEDARWVENPTSCYCFAWPAGGGLRFGGKWAVKASKMRDGLKTRLRVKDHASESKTRAAWSQATPDYGASKTNFNRDIPTKFLYEAPHHSSATDQAANPYGVLAWSLTR